MGLLGFGVISLFAVCIWVLDWRNIACLDAFRRLRVLFGFGVLFAVCGWFDLCLGVA